MTDQNDEYLSQISNRAIQNGIIDTHSICEILAKDSDYPLDFFFKRLELYSKFSSKVSEKNLKTFEGRAGAWFHIIHRLTTGKDITGISRGYSPINNSGLLPLYGFEADCMEYLPYKKANQILNEKNTHHLPWPQDGEPSGYIKLEDIKKWFTEYLKQPLPKRLFPPNIDSSNKTGNNKNSLEENVLKELSVICPELEKFYSSLIRELDDIGTAGSIDEINQSDLYSIALKLFKRNPSEYKILNEILINDENIFVFVSRRRRKIIASILKKHINSKFPDDIEQIDTSINSLSSQHNAIILT